MSYADIMMLRGAIVSGFVFRKRLQSGIKLSVQAVFDYDCAEIIVLWRKAGLY